MIIHEARAKSEIQDDYRLMESLAKDKKRVLFERTVRPGVTVKYTMEEMLRGVQEKHGDRKALQLALMMENQRRYYESLDESTRLAFVGQDDRWSFPAVKVIFPNLIAHELVPVQTMKGPSAKVWYMKLVYGKTKGQALAGQDIIENPNANYAGRLVEDESQGVGDGGAAYVGTLDWIPLIAGKVTIYAGTQILVDDGKGVLSGDGSGTINYSTGAFDVTFTAVVAATVEILATYEYDNEGNSLQPEMDLVITGSTVEAVTEKMTFNISLESLEDFKIVNGVDADAEIMAAKVSEMKFEIDNKIILDLMRIALNTEAKWDGTKPSGVSYTEHKLSIIDSLVKGSNEIYRTTQRARGNWIVAGLDACNVLETLPGFKGDGMQVSGRGVQYIGTLNNRWKIFCNTYITGTDILHGFKGDNMWNTGYIYAPYQLYRQTPDIILTDFMLRKGTYTRYGKKVVDGKFYCMSGVKNLP